MEMNFWKVITKTLIFEKKKTQLVLVFWGVFIFINDNV